MRNGRGEEGRNGMSTKREQKEDYLMQESKEIGKEIMQVKQEREQQECKR